MRAFLEQLSSLPWEQASRWLFLLPALLMLVGAVLAVALRNLIHCALALALSFAALGVLFMALGAEFVGFVQILVYVGAVTMLMLFAILLTPVEEVAASNNPLKERFSLPRAGNTALGALLSSLVLMGLWSAVWFSPAARAAALPAKTPQAPVAAIGENLLSHTLLPLQATALLLTAALIGAALLALEEKKDF